MTVSGRMPPSRWSCSSTLGTVRIWSSVGLTSLCSHLIHHERHRGRRFAADGERARRTQRFQRRAEAGGIVGVQLQDRLTLLEVISGLGQAADAGRVADVVLLARAAGAQAPRRDADRERAEVRYPAG